MKAPEMREVLESPGEDGEELLASLTESREERLCPSPWRAENRALLAAYFSAGFALAYLGTPLGFYMVTELDAPSAQQATVWTAMSLPWGVKVLLGLLSDCLPIGGLRRKPHLLLGWTVFLQSNLVLGLLGRPGVRELAPLVFAVSLVPTLRPYPSCPR